MGLFSRKKQATGGSSAVRAFHLVFHVGDGESGRMVSEDVLNQLIGATKEPALEALDRRFGGESWCPEIATNASQEGPAIYFNLDINIPPGRTEADMSDIVCAEFRRTWADATERLLT